MTKFVVKESSSDCFPGKLYAEDVTDSSNWHWLSPAAPYTVGTEFSEVDPIHVAADDGMQAAIGAAHVEAHDEPDDVGVVSSDFISLGDVDPTERARDIVRNVVLKEGESASVVNDLTPEDKQKLFATAQQMIADVIFGDDFGYAGSYLVLSSTDGEKFEIQGNMNPMTAAPVLEAYLYRIMGIPADVADMLASRHEARD
jgi:hypothetical protein